jgi:hypothetical protein
MKAPLSRTGIVLRGQPQKRDHTGKPTIKAKNSRFDTLVARYYPAVYRLALRLTDDPWEGIVLTRYAFNSTRKQLRTCGDENVVASILISNVIRAGLTEA